MGMVTKKIKTILAATFLLASTICSAQTQYSGTDAASSLVAKQTLSNLALYSEQFENAAWAIATLDAIASNSIVAPDGTTTADTVDLTATTSAGRYLYPTAGITTVNGSTYRMSMYMKKGTHSFVQMYSQHPATASIDVDLNAGTILRTGATTISPSITNVGNGWYLVSFSYITNATGNYITLTPLKDAVTVANTSWTSTGAETFYIWGAALNLASAPRDYIATTSAAVTLAGVCPSGTSQSYIDPSKCYAVTTAPISCRIAPFTGTSN